MAGEDPDIFGDGSTGKGPESSPKASPRRGGDRSRLDLFDEQDSGDEKPIRRSEGLAETAGDMLSIKMVSLLTFISSRVLVLMALWMYNS